MLEEVYCSGYNDGINHASLSEHVRLVNSPRQPHLGDLVTVGSVGEGTLTEDADGLLTVTLPEVDRLTPRVLHAVGQDGGPIKIREGAYVRLDMGVEGYTHDYLLYREGDWFVNGNYVLREGHTIKPVSAPPYTGEDPRE